MVTFGTGPSLNGTTDFSIGAWVKTSAAAAQVIMQQRDTVGFVGEYRLSLTASGTVAFMVYGSGGYQYNFATTQTVNDGAWHHVTAVRSGANGYIYIDGVQAATASGTVQSLSSTIGVGIGADIRDNNAFFNGQIDEVLLFRRALSSADVLSLFQSYGSNPPVTYTPSSYSVTQGTYGSGNAASLTSDDNNYLIINSQTSGNVRYAGADLTCTGVTGVPTRLDVSVTAKSSSSGTSQTLQLWNYNTSAWDTFSSGTIGTAESTQTFSVTTGAANYVSGGQIQVGAIASKAKRTFTLSLDRVAVSVTAQ
jgi:hypothetical protein